MSLQETFENTTPDESVEAWAIRAGSVLGVLAANENMLKDTEKVRETISSLVARMPANLLVVATLNILEVRAGLPAPE